MRLVRYAPLLITLLSGAASAATLGNSGSPGDLRSVSGAMRCLLIAIPVDFTVDAIRFSLQTTGSPNHRAVLYEGTGGTLVDQSAIRNDIASTFTLEEFTGFSTDVHPAGTYYVCVLADTGQTSSVEYGAGLTYDGYGNTPGDLDADSPPDPHGATLDGGERDWIGEIEYTEASASSASIPAIYRHLRQQKQ